MRIVLLAVLSLALVLSVSAKWTDICANGTSAKCPSIMMGVSCKDASLCAVVGGYSNTPMAVYYSSDLFNSFTKAEMKQSSLMLMDIAVDHNGAGATAGMGIGNSSALLYTHDLTSWQASSDHDFMVGQDINAFGNGEFGFVGTTNTLLNTEGVLISQDGGADWKPFNWPAALANLTEARYGSFPSDQTLYVTGGNWPSSSELFEHGPTCLSLSYKTCIEVGLQHSPQVTATRARRASKQQLGETNGYLALLTKSADGGKTWQVQFQDQDNFYFNDISCIDTTHCFAVGEGFTDGKAPGARIYGTTDGQNWKQVFISTADNASLMRVTMVSRSEAWAAGGQVVNGVPYGTFWHTTDGGATWQLDSQVQYTGDVTAFHFTDSTLGFAVGITEFQTSTAIRYSA